MKTWFITGCSTGFGRELAQLALERGDRVAATARRPESLSHLAASYGSQVLAIPLNVDSDSSVSEAVRDAVDEFDRIDVVVNNAGYGMVGALEEFSDEEILRQFQTNVFGVLRVMRHAIPILRQQRSGHIMNVTSVAGFRSRPGFGLYCSSKFAVEAIGEANYHELKPLGIHVTNVAPGVFRTDFAGRSHVRAANRIDDYAETAHANIEWLGEVDGNQTGDPRKAAQAMFDLAYMQDPPLRLALGPDAVQGITDKLASVAADIDRMREISVSTDIESK